MSRLKRLIFEIHRRSLWQVLLIYVGGAWVCYEIIDTITDRLALPEWLPVLAIILFLIGLPIVMATAFVGEVEAPSRAPAEAEAGEAAEAAAARLEVRRRHRFLTWRNALATFVVALAVWGIVATGWLVLHEGARETDVERKSVAVLPFVNLSGDPDNEYFSDGVTGDIINHLSRIADLKVISRTSVMQYKGTTRSLREIGDELGVATVLEGEVQRIGDRVRINAQLIDAETDAHLWGEQYNRELTDVFAIQSDVAQQIALALKTTLTAAEKVRIEERPTESLEAYDNYLRGRYFWNQRTLVAFDSAIDYYNRAILLDPNYARAYAGLAETYVLLPEYSGRSMPEALPLARAAIERARTLDPDLAETYAASAYVKFHFEWNYDAAELDYLKAIELDPDYATAHQWYVELLGTTGRLNEALAEAQKAVELDPLSPAANHALRAVLAYAGNPDEGIPGQLRALDIAPDFAPAIYLLAITYVMKGDYTAAAPVFDRVAALTGCDPEAYRAYLAALADPARIPEAVTLLQAPDVYGTARGSEYLAQLGRYDEALAILEQLYEERHPYLPYVNMDPAFEGMRSDPRFQDLLRRMNFPN
jgi:TolB-like protein/Flp pilus assembly protein TadD